MGEPRLGRCVFLKNRERARQTAGGASIRERAARLHRYKCEIRLVSDAAPRYFGVQLPKYAGAYAVELTLSIPEDVFLQFCLGALLPYLFSGQDGQKAGPELVLRGSAVCKIMRTLQSWQERGNPFRASI
jgi:hypothetical protein